MPLLFVANDGTWGDAEGLRVVAVTDEQISALNDQGEQQALETLSGLDAIAIFS